jgi:uncharacterized protein (TIGR00369 family)
MDRLTRIDGFNAALGLEVVSASADEVVVRMPIGPHLHQAHGIVHGGVWCALVETAASIGAGYWNEGGDSVGVTNTTDFVRAVRSGTVTARAVPLHRGRLQQLWTVDVADAEGRRVAHGQVRLQNLDTADRIGRPPAGGVRPEQAS